MNIRYTLLTLIIFIHTFQCDASTLDRVIDTSKSIVNVQLTATLDSTVLAYNVEETLPAGAIPSTISHDGIFHSSSQCIKWGTFLDRTTRTLSYSFVIDPGTYDMQGNMSPDGNLITKNQNFDVSYFPLNIALYELPPTQISDNYWIQLTTTGGYLPYAFALAYGSLPNGISLNPDTGEIAGSPLSLAVIPFR